MFFNHRVRFVAPFAIAALALGMTACAQDEPESTPTVTVTEAVEETPSMESSEPMEEASEPTVSEEPSEEPAGPNDESGVVDVTVTGDQGILALQHSGTTPAGAAGPASEKLIVGPSGCFSLVNKAGQPNLLVFPDDATFVLQEGKPSATIDGTEYLVGRQFSVPTTTVEKTNVAGIPQQCTEGANSTVLVVS